MGDLGGRPLPPPSCPKRIPERKERPIQNAGTNRPDKVHNEVEVVDRGQAQGQRLARVEEMAQITPAKVLAGVAAAAHLDRAVIVDMARGLDLEATIGGVERAVAGKAGRCDTVEEIDA